jgi:hypothetical protein
VLVQECTYPIKTAKKNRKIMALQEFLLSGYEIKKHRHDDGGDSACPPLPPLR